MTFKFHISLLGMMGLGLQSLWASVESLSSFQCYQEKVGEGRQDLGELSEIISAFGVSNTAKTYVKVAGELSKDENVQERAFDDLRQVSRIGIYRAGVLSVERPEPGSSLEASNADASGPVETQYYGINQFILDKSDDDELGQSFINYATQICSNEQFPFATPADCGHAAWNRYQNYQQLYNQNQGAIDEAVAKFGGQIADGQNVDSKEFRDFFSGRRFNPDQVTWTHLQYGFSRLINLAPVFPEPHNRANIEAASLNDPSLFSKQGRVQENSRGLPYAVWIEVSEGSEVRRYLAPIISNPYSPRPVALNPLWIYVLQGDSTREDWNKRVIEWGDTL